MRWALSQYPLPPISTNRLMVRGLNVFPEAFPTVPCSLDSRLAGFLNPPLIPPAYSACSRVAVKKRSFLVTAVARSLPRLPLLPRHHLLNRPLRGELENACILISYGFPFPDTLAGGGPAILPLAILCADMPASMADLVCPDSCREQQSRRFVLLPDVWVSQDALAWNVRMRSRRSNGRALRYFA